MEQNEPTKLTNAGKLSSYFVQFPLPDILDFDLTGSDYRVYAALDLLCGERGWWYGEQPEIMMNAAERLSELSIPGSIQDVSSITINRAIRKLKDKKLIVVEAMGMKTNNILKYYVVARKPKLPPIHRRR